MADWIRGSQPLLQLWPTSREFFLPNGVAPRRGEVFREPALGKTLRALVSAEAKAKGRPRRAPARGSRLLLQRPHRARVRRILRSATAA